MCEMEEKRMTNPYTFTVYPTNIYIRNQVVYTECMIGVGSIVRV